MLDGTVVDARLEAVYRRRLGRGAASDAHPATRVRILVPSALYGVTTAEDQIVDYRLTMHAALPGLGNLARYWRQPLTEALRALRVA